MVVVIAQAEQRRFNFGHVTAQKVTDLGQRKRTCGKQAE